MTQYPKLPLDLLGHLIMLVFVAEGRGFSAAARALGKTPSTISRAMSQLEDRLQTQIFVRSRQAVRLTPAGEEIFRSCKAMHLAATHVFDVCREQQQTLSGSLKIAGPKTLMKVVVAPLVRDFLGLFPAIDVQMIADDRDFNLVKEQIDILFKINPDVSPQHSSRSLGEISYVLCASRRYLFLTQPIVEPTDLLLHRCMHFGETSMDALWTFRKGELETRIEVDSGFLINHSEALLEAAEADMGVALLPNFVAMPAIAAGRLVRVLSDYEVHWPHCGDLLLVTPFEANVPRRVTAFIEQIVGTVDLNSALRADLG